MAIEFVEHKSIQNFDLYGGKTPLLNSIDVILTERCNNACIHCSVAIPEKDKKAQSEELSTEEVISYLKDATELGAMFVNITGGEPMVHKDFDEI